MTPSLRIGIVGVAAILLFDAGGAMASLVLGFPYALLSLGSFLIQATVGFLATRASSLRVGVAVATGVAAVESTIGWSISWAIGPGRPATELRSVGLVIAAAIIVTVTGTICGLLGGGLARLLTRRQAPSNKRLQPTARVSSCDRSKE
jgi:hypothetical protein